MLKTCAMRREAGAFEGLATAPADVSAVDRGRVSWASSANSSASAIDGVQLLALLRRDGVLAGRRPEYGSDQQPQRRRCWKSLCPLLRAGSALRAGPQSQERPTGVRRNECDPGSDPQVAAKLKAGGVELVDVREPGEYAASASTARALSALDLDPNALPKCRDHFQCALASARACGGGHGRRGSNIRRIRRRHPGMARAGMPTITSIPRPQAREITSERRLLCAHFTSFSCGLCARIEFSAAPSPRTASRCSRYGDRREGGVATVESAMWCRRGRGSAAGGGTLRPPGRPVERGPGGGDGGDRSWSCSSARWIRRSPR